MRKVIKNMKNNKAAGIDKIIPELFKGFNDQMFDVIEISLNLIFEKEACMRNELLVLQQFYSGWQN